jgi:hypothetical protein
MSSWGWCSTIKAQKQLHLSGFIVLIDIYSLCIFEVLAAEIMKSSDFSDMSRNPFKIIRRLRETCLLLLQDWSSAWQRLQASLVLDFFFCPDVPPKRRSIFNGPHCVISQKIELFILLVSTPRTHVIIPLYWHHCPLDALMIMNWDNFDAGFVSGVDVDYYFIRFRLLCPILKCIPLNSPRFLSGCTCKCALDICFPILQFLLYSLMFSNCLYMVMLLCTELTILVLRRFKFRCIVLNLAIWCCHVSQWLRRAFGLVIRFIGYLQVVTKNNYNTLADLQNLQSLHTILLRLLPLVFTIRFLATDL